MSMMIQRGLAAQGAYTAVAAKKQENTVKEAPAKPDGENLSAKAAADEFWARHDMLYAQQTASALNKINDGRQTALEIYRRMASGAIVSQSDEQSLMKYDPNMYQAAKMSQQMAERHEDMSDESLMEEFVKRHENDRTDWTSELDEDIQGLNEAADTEAGAEPVKIDVQV